ncbi:hypothetical protein LSH36_12g36175 [Paralvinella palmiformis]|uniref:Uncharacterized protein n=1 Tax=Paralvinella palmiformis TaxID=53620 RepID=A0AAD9KDS2_9ANNE|nr:hypothetical protein LSH36_12g36175 [Paralvinella palmiformis]
MQAIKRDQGPLFQFPNYISVCNRHSTPNDFKKGVVGPKGGRLLEHNSVPNVFSWTVPKNIRVNGKDKM